ncbi:MAG: methylated-DNA--[protein]-cysteine S-methyltransferase, partial [Bacteroidetes bacterium]|nr:methylated-DNA--[protein]-cysteine S-methyltransferase [Bacteroidota bacterium]
MKQEGRLSAKISAHKKEGMHMVLVRAARLSAKSNRIERMRSGSSIRGSVTFHAGLDGTSIHKIFCASFESPIGVVYIASNENGLCKISLPKDGRSSFFAWINDNFSADDIVDDRRMNAGAIRQLNEYLIGKRTKFDIDVDLIGTPFQQRLWTEISKVPYGTTATYKQIGKRIHTNGYRAVGSAVSKNPLPIVIPCHRVIGS